MRSHSLVLVLLCSVAACGRRAHESRDAFRWEEEIPPGSTIHLGTMIGQIDVVPAEGRSASVAGSTRWVGRKDPVHFAWRRDGSDVYVCALLTTNGECGDERRGMFGGPDHSWLDIFSLFKRRSTNVVASLRVTLPAGVKVEAHTIDGTIAMRGATAGVSARVVNGSIDIEKSAGPIEARGTNSKIRVVLDSLAPDDPIRLETVNGSMTAVLPANLDGDVQLSTVNGRVKSDFPIGATGDNSNHHLRGQIGKSSREVRLKTVNGNVSLLKQRGETPGGEAAAADHTPQ